MFLIFNFNSEAFGHGIQCMLSPREIRIGDETFSAMYISEGDIVTVKAMLVNLKNYDRDVTIGAILDNDRFSYFLNSKILGLFLERYCGALFAFDGNPDWYFQYEINPDLEVIRAYENKSYEIKLTPVVSGKYHIHSVVTTGNVTFYSPGQTVYVTGTSQFSEKEIVEFYLPFSIIVSSISLGVAFLIIRFIRNKIMSRKT